MSTERRRPEAEFQSRVLDLAYWTGWKVAHWHDSRRQIRPGVFVGDKDAAGFPDLVLCHPDRGRVLFRELKAETGRLRPKQRAWLEALSAAGADVGVWTPADWSLIEATLKGAR